MAWHVRIKALTSNDPKLVFIRREKELRSIRLL